MKKISKILTIFALCSLFTFSNTSGIEETTPLKKSAPPPIDFVAGQWYQLNDYYYHYEQPEVIDGFISTTYEGDFGVYYSHADYYFSCHKIYFSSTHWTLYYGNNVLSIFYDEANYYGEYLSICFSEYTPNSLISYYKYFKLKDNDNYDKVYLKESFNLKTSNYNPLIYLGGSIFDNVYAQTPYELPSTKDLIIFEGRFVSGGNEYTSIVLTYQNFEGVRYTFDNGETYKTVPVVADSNFRYGVADISYVVNGVKTSIINTTLVVVGQNMNALVLPFTYRYAGNEKLTIYEYSTAHPLFHSPSYNMYELLKLRPADNPIGTDITDSEGGLLGGAFGLIGLVFTSLAGFLSFQLFPGLTLGLLILIPLVITIIVLIFKATK